MSSRRTPLFDAHSRTDASLTDFGGWEMPVSFTSIRAEHAAVRTDVGKFDVSHMGQIEVSGPDATALMDRLTTNDVASLGPGRAQYAAITDEAGVMLDDTIIYRVDDGDDPRFLFVPNAGLDGTMTDRWREHRDASDLKASVDNRTTDHGMIALQGPDAEGILDPMTDAPLADLGRFGVRETAVAGTPCLVARTGYTGEDGFEVLTPWADTPAVWDAFEGQPCGLGSRDTLRLEAGLLLRGNEFHPEDNPRTPLEAGIDFAVDLEGAFLGRDALARQAEDGPEQVLVGFGMADRGIPRTGYELFDDAGDPVGAVTSGTHSPTLDRAIGLGYVDAGLVAPDTPLQVAVRGRQAKAKVESLPFVE